jgi:hypothetical protein
MTANSLGSRSPSFITAIGELASNHPFLALSIALYVAIALAVGAIHETRFAGEVVLLGLRFLKMEMNAYRDLWRRLKRELTTWKSDP